MIEFRIHGRGGQGNVSAAYLLAAAAFESGRMCQAFPSFGAERRGAPVTAFVRIDDRMIRMRSQGLMRYGGQVSQTCLVDTSNSNRNVNHGQFHAEGTKSPRPKPN